MSQIYLQREAKANVRLAQMKAIERNTEYILTLDEEIEDQDAYLNELLGEPKKVVTKAERDAKSIYHSLKTV